MVRADAERNRARLVAAAAEVFGESGPAASLDAVARRAGVGSGTLYRHFPGRDELLRAVYRTRVSDACARGRALASAADPFDALACWLRLLLELSARHGLGAALLQSVSTGPASFAHDCHVALTEVGPPLLARAADRVRSDVTLDDLHALVVAIAAASAPAADPAGRAERLLAMVLDGLRAAPR